MVSPGFVFLCAPDLSFLNPATTTPKLFSSPSTFYFEWKNFSLKSKEKSHREKNSPMFLIVRSVSFEPTFSPYIPAD